MIKTVRKTKVQGQDALRRADMHRMAPAERVNALIEARDRAYPYHGLVHRVSRRILR